MSIWRGPRGIRVEQILLDRGRGPRQVLRIVQHTPYGAILVADAGSVREVAEHVDLADLCEVIDLPVRRA